MAGRSDVEVLSRSFRSRVLLLGLLVLAGLAAAVWTSTRESGIGAPEDRRRILVATAGSGIDYYAVLEKGGFAIEVDELDDWLTRAREAAPESEAEGVALLLEHADREGIALVVLERPRPVHGEVDGKGDWLALDWGKLKLDPPLDSIERLAEREYLAVSVGDYGFPHRVSADDPGDDPVVRLPGYGALQAVYRQALISARESADRPTVAELQFEHATRLAREMAGRPAEFATTIARERASVEAALDDGSGARSLVPMLATGTGIATPDGGILLLHHELMIYSDDARTLALEAAPQMQLSWISPSAVAAGLASGEFVREPCTALAGGVLAMAETPRIEVAVDGSAIAIETGEGGATVWRKTDAPGCEWDAAAEIDRITGVVLAPRFAPASEPGSDRSLAARAENVGDNARVLLWSTREDQTGEQLDLQVLLWQSNHRFGALAFVDDRHLAVASLAFGEDEQADQEHVYLLDRTRPDVYLSVPAELFAADRWLREVVALAPASEASGPELLITAEASPGGRVELIRLRVGADAWHAFTSTPELGVEGTKVSLTPEQIEAERMTEVDGVLGLDAKAGRLLVSLVDGARTGELALLSLADGTVRRLTDNETRDYQPRLSADGSHAVFVSLIQLDLARTPFSVPRVIALPGAQ